MLKGYIAQLEQMTAAANAAAAERAATQKSEATSYTPLTTQLQNLFATLPATQRNRDWTVAELISRVKGQYRAAPSAAKVAAALKQLGFTQCRDYSKAGGGARLWRRV